MGGNGHAVPTLKKVLLCVWGWPPGVEWVGMMGEGVAGPGIEAARARSQPYTWAGHYLALSQGVLPAIMLAGRESGHCYL